MGIGLYCYSAEFLHFKPPTDAKAKSQVKSEEKISKESEPKTEEKNEPQSVKGSLTQRDWGIATKVSTSGDSSDYLSIGIVFQAISSLKKTVISFIGDFDFESDG